jgi:cobalt-zinc-cadmium efflux system membrane fusion protein
MIIISILAAAALLSACNQDTTEAADEAATATGSTSSAEDRISYQQAEPGSLLDLYELPAEVVIPEESVVEVGLQVSFRVERWQVRTGDEVSVGDPLATVVSPDLRDLASEVSNARSVLSERRAIVEEQSQAVEAGFQSKDTLYEARAALAQARADLSAARQRLAERTSGRLKPDGNRWTWTSPAAGTVGEMTCSTGRLLSPGTSCFRLGTPARAEVRVAVPERFIPQIDSQTKGTWTSASQLHTEGGVALDLARRAPALDPRTRAQTHFFRVPDKPEDNAESADPTPPLQPGASGRIELHVDARDGLVRVPKLAVTRIQGRDHVFVRPADGEPQPVPVETYGQRGEDLLVAGEGLEAGDSVVSRGAFYLKSVLTFQ